MRYSHFGVSSVNYSDSETDLFIMNLAKAFGEVPQSRLSLRE